MLYGLIRLFYVYRPHSIFSFFRPVYFTFYGVRISRGDAHPRGPSSALGVCSRKPRNGDHPYRRTPCGLSYLCFRGSLRLQGPMPQK